MLMLIKGKCTEVNDFKNYIAGVSKELNWIEDLGSRCFCVIENRSSQPQPPLLFIASKRKYLVSWNHNDALEMLIFNRILTSIRLKTFTLHYTNQTAWIN